MDTQRGEHDRSCGAALSPDERGPTRKRRGQGTLRLFATTGLATAGQHGDQEVSVGFISLSSTMRVPAEVH